MKNSTFHMISSGSRDIGNVPMYIAPNTFSGSLRTIPTNISGFLGYNITLWVTGAIGTGSIWIANDFSNANGTSIDRWFRLQPNIDQVLSSSNLGPDWAVWNMPNQYNRWVQLRWEHQSGTGSIDSWGEAKGM